MRHTRLVRRPSTRQGNTRTNKASHPICCRVVRPFTRILFARGSGQKKGASPLLWWCRTSATEAWPVGALLLFGGRLGVGKMLRELPRQLGRSAHELPSPQFRGFRSLPSRREASAVAPITRRLDVRSKVLARPVLWYSVQHTPRYLRLPHLPCARTFVMAT